MTRPLLREFLSIMTAFENLPSEFRGNRIRNALTERRREKTVAQERLARLVQTVRATRFTSTFKKPWRSLMENPGTRKVLTPCTRFWKPRPIGWPIGKRPSMKSITAVSLISMPWPALRIENPDVFRLTHQLTMRYIAEGKITGLRIDHPDGLYDPAGYFEALQDIFPAEVGPACASSFIRKTGHGMPRRVIAAWRVAERKKDPKGLAARPLYVVAEKILSHG